ncbi:MAG: polysaccharide deacetylase family protein [Deltaproteobacteria bacterium]|jgi:peptidoglycan/xylan/chitin deacetylase (PgdA/CDA1 family)|nr:polysaccharide deacetylase family protein [Deltaproteobacteria bacterium]
MQMCVQVYDRVRRSFLMFACCLTFGVVVPAAHAFQVADGMALLRQAMPANYCALTFDDGPGSHTAALLDLLAVRGIAATFFVVGQNAERRPALIKRMLAEGHEVANHSYSHADMRRLAPEAQTLEMKRTWDLLHSLGAEVRYFRPPYGRYTPVTAAKAEDLGMTILLWSLDSQDWKRHASRLEGLRSVSPVEQQAFSGMRGVFLFHDTHKRTVEAMPEILDALRAGGCERFVTVSEYMTKIPREEEQRLVTRVPDKGRGEMPLPLRAGLSGDTPDDVALQSPEDTRLQRMSGAGMRTQPAHAAAALNHEMTSSSMRIQPAHGIPGIPPPVSAPEVLMVGIVTHEQALPVTRPPLSFARSGSSATPPQRASAAVRGQIPQLLSSPDLVLPAHRPSRSKQDIRRGENGPG